jgi:pSer/pThr/pTyr-binding forkhead associated (FHA) protein
MTAGPRYKLRSNSGAQIELDRDLTTLGRSPDSHIFVADSNASRRHAVIEREGEAYWLEDVGARNGTWINAERVIERVMLEDGDIIRIGNTWFIFEIVPEPTRRMEPGERPVTGVFDDPVAE